MGLTVGSKAEAAAQAVDDRGSPGAAARAGLPAVPVRSRRRWAWPAVAIAALAFAYLFPPFRVVRLNAPAATAADGVFEPRAFAEAFWRDDLQRAVARAVDAAALDQALDRDPAAAAQAYARRVGIGGAAYYFVAGEGTITAVERNAVHVSVGPDAPSFVLLTGPVFGNTLRDGTGLLDVNTFVRSQDFNAVSAALNALVEERVQPLLRERAVVGARVRFAGCAEAGEPDRDPRPLRIVPIQAEVR